MRDVPTPRKKSKYEVQFEQHMANVDEFAQVILKGQLIVEGALDNILALIFFHPERLQPARLSFRQKVALARAYALRKDTLDSWNLMLSINAVRNEIAHNLTGEKRTQKIQQLRRMYLAGAGDKLRDEYKEAPNHVIAFFACVEVTGFLGALEEDITLLRGYVNALDATLNPEGAKGMGGSKS